MKEYAKPYVNYRTSSGEQNLQIQMCVYIGSQNPVMVIKPSNWNRIGHRLIEELKKLGNATDTSEI